MTSYLIGRTVKVADAFRLGRRSEHSVSGDSRPRPILIKLVNCWDKRLLLSSCRKLEYTPHKLFIWEDLTPDARKRYRKPSQDAIQADSAPATTTLASSQKGDHDSVINSKISATQSSWLPTLFLYIAIIVVAGEVVLIMFVNSCWHVKCVVYKSTGFFVKVWGP